MVQLSAESGASLGARRMRYQDSTWMYISTGVVWKPTNALSPGSHICVWEKHHLFISFGDLLIQIRCEDAFKFSSHISRLVAACDIHAYLMLMGKQQFGNVGIFPTCHRTTSQILLDDMTG